MIVKVQLSQFDSEGRKMMLIYDKRKKFLYEDEATEDVLKLMGEDQKKFFNAELIPHPKNWTKGEKVVQLNDEAAWQNW